MLFSLTLPWPEPSLLTFLRRAGGLPRFFWENDQYPLAFAGFGAAAVLTASGPGRFAAIREGAAALFAGAGEFGEAASAGPRLFGGFAFETAPPARPLPPGDIWEPFPEACFALPRYLLTRVDGHTWLTLSRVPDPAESLRETENLLHEALWDLPTPKELPRFNGYAQDSLPPTGLLSLPAWTSIVSRATARIRRGDFDKVVLAQARRLASPHPPNPLLLLDRLAGRHPDCFRFLFEPAPEASFYGATPELLAEVTGPAIRTVALAGSARRGATLAEDHALGAQLLASPKERHEHALVVQAIEASLRPLTSRLCVPETPGLLPLSNIQHLHTPIEGELAAPSGILPVVEALHPTPAVGGLPRETALAAIRESEPLPRGWYAAPIGWLDAQSNGLFAVAIRSAVSRGCETRLFAGAGIVADSDPEREWHETHLKLRPLLEALGGALAG